MVILCTCVSVFCILYSVLCIQYSVFCILYSVFCILYSVFYILYFVVYASMLGVYIDVSFRATPYNGPPSPSCMGGYEGGGSEYVIFLLCTGGVSYIHTCSPPPPHPYSLFYRGRILGRIQTKAWRVFLLIIQSHLFRFALKYLFLQTHATFCSFCSALLYTVKKGGKHDRKPHPVPYGLINLKSENSQDYAQKPLWNRMLMNSASEQFINQPLYEKNTYWVVCSKSHATISYRLCFTKLRVIFALRDFFQ